MIQYYVTNALGGVVRTGICHENDLAAQAGAGEMVHLGTVSVQEPPVFDATDYRNQRFLEYPSLRDQLDALWHGMNSGVLPKAEPFYSMIKSVKDKYPKG